LVDYYLEIIAGEYGQVKKSIESDAMDMLQSYDWTGNIRELRNVVERLIILSGKTITLEDVQNYVLPKK
jgi:DNA-binding NtrC family response regulator